jgi:PIN domain nuclease of toxin-antitoxin system
LATDIRDAISDSDNEVYLSIISIWECIIKYKLGKLPLPQSPDIYLPKQRDRHQIINLNLDESSVLQLTKLPSLHRDPFDRMLICQALQHNLSIATADKAIRAYPIKLI